MRDGPRVGLGFALGLVTYTVPRERLLPNPKPPLPVIQEYVDAAARVSNLPAQKGFGPKVHRTSRTGVWRMDGRQTLRKGRQALIPKFLAQDEESGTSSLSVGGRSRRWVSSMALD